MPEKYHRGRKQLQGVLETRLALERARAGISQAHLAAAAGIPLTTYRRLERGAMWNPPIRYLTNLALVLDVHLLDICEDGWLEWSELSGGVPDLPEKELLYDGHRWMPNLPEEHWRPLKEPRRYDSFVPDREPFEPITPTNPD